MENNFLEKLKTVNADIRAKKFAPFYFIYGEEYFFISKLLLNIKKGFVDNTGLNIKTYDEDNLDMDEVIKYVVNMPFMNDKKLIIFKDIELFSKKENKKDSKVSGNAKTKNEQLLEAFDKGRDTNIIVVIMNEYDRKYDDKYKNGNVFIDFFAKNGIVINSKKLDENELSKYVISCFKKYGIDIDKVLAMYLIKNVGKSLSNIYNEIDKIVSFIGEKKQVTNNDIDACVSKNIEDNVFKLIDLLNANRQSDALTLYGDLLSEGVNHFAIFSILSNNYKDMIVVKSMIEKSKSLKEIADTTRFPEWKVRNIMNACKGITKDAIVRKLLKITKLNTDYMYGDVSESIMLETLFY